MKNVLVMLLLLAAVSVNAQIDAILGNWKTVDDKTGDNFSVVHIYKATDGLYYGRIAKLLVGDPDQVCVECEGSDHNRPLEGLVIIRGMKYNADKNQLEGGKVLEPATGKFYYGKIYPKDGNLVLRGSLDKLGVLGRSQTWIRK